MIRHAHPIHWWALGALVGYLLVALVVWRVAAGHVAWERVVRRKRRGERYEGPYGWGVGPAWSFGLIVGLGWGLGWLPLLLTVGLWRIGHRAWTRWPFPMGYEREGRQILREQETRALERQVGIGDD